MKVQSLKKLSVTFATLCAILTASQVTLAKSTGNCEDEAKAAALKFVAHKVPGSNASFLNTYITPLSQSVVNYTIMLELISESGDESSEQIEVDMDESKTCEIKTGSPRFAGESAGY